MQATRVVPPGPPLQAPRPAPVVAAEVPRLTTGVELIGRFEDSGFKEPPYIARRRDGQIVQLAPLLFVLAEQIDGRRDLHQIAAAFSDRIQRGVDADMVRELLDAQLRPLGIVAMANGHTGELSKVDPLLALRFRTRVVPAGVVRAITTVFRHLFHPEVVTLALLAFVGLDFWLFGIHGISQSLRHVLYDPALLLGLLGGMVVATAFHEIGHASAVRYGGARPGVMGVGIYIVWPAFYTDITDAYRLGRRGRLRADLGGMYFNALFAVAMGAVYAATGFEPVLLLIVLQNFTIVQQSLPFLRLDGYYVVSDLTGVPDMFFRIGAVLRSLAPWRQADGRVTELKPWVRWAVSGYVMTVVPILVLTLLLMVVHAPRAFATGYDSVALHRQMASAAFGHGRTMAGITDVLQMLFLTLPAIGFVYTVARLGRRAGPAAWRWSAASAWRRPALAVLAGGAAVALAFLWWPRGDYRPIQPGERGTIVSAIKSLANVPSGRAALTPQRALQLDGAPLRSAQHGRHDGGASTGTGSVRSLAHRRGSADDGSLDTTTFPDEGPSIDEAQPDPTGQAPFPATGTPTQSTPPPASTAPAPAAPAPAPTSSTPSQTTTTTSTSTTPTTTQTTTTDTTTTDTTPTQTTTTDTTPTQTTTTPSP